MSASTPDLAAAAAAPAAGGSKKSMLGKFKTNEEIIAFLRK